MKRLPIADEIADGTIFAALMVEYSSLVREAKKSGNLRKFDHYLRCWYAAQLAQDMVFKLELTPELMLGKWKGYYDD